MFWMRNKENSHPKCTLIWRPEVYYSWSVYHAEIFLCTTLFPQFHPVNVECSGSVGRVLDWGSKGFLFKIHWCNCVVSLSKTLYLLLSIVKHRKTGNAEKLLTGT